MDSVRTSILGGPRPLPSHRHADHAYTVICEEPVIGGPTRASAQLRDQNLGSVDLKG